MPQDVAAPLSDGRYRLLQVLGVGGMATVYLAQDMRLGVARAVKVLAPTLMRSGSLRKRFLSEARTMARLHHPNIVTVHDVGIDEDRAFMVMDLMEGGNLVDVLQRDRRLTPGQALPMIDGILAGLEAAHEMGVVHRDVKPANLLLTSSGKVRLCDFGIARVASEDQHLTRTGSVLGTFGYMAPEQRNDSKAVDVRADLFSASATLYALVTGKEPIDLYAVEVHARAFAGMPADLVAFIQQGTNYDPAGRWQDTAAMRRDLAPLLKAYPAEYVEPMGLPEHVLLPHDDHSDRVVKELRSNRPAGLAVADKAIKRQAIREFGTGLGIVLAVGAVVWLAWALVT